MEKIIAKFTTLNIILSSSEISNLIRGEIVFENSSRKEIFGEENDFNDDERLSINIKISDTASKELIFLKTYMELKENNEAQSIRNT